MYRKYYLEELFPLQDRILSLIQRINVPFYLGGGTALSRCYLNHRFSDDLDFFLNADPDFKKYCTTVVAHLREVDEWQVEAGATSDTFLRILLEKGKVTLKLDFINDVKFHYDEFEKCTIFNKVDNWRNILSNKLCALSRRDVKDLVDILFISKKYDLSWEDIFREAKEKDLWADPIEVCKIISEFPKELLSTINWVSAVDIDEIYLEIHTLHDDIFWGRENTLAKS